MRVPVAAPPRRCRRSPAGRAGWRRWSWRAARSRTEDAQARRARRRLDAGVGREGDAAGRCRRAAAGPTSRPAALIGGEADATLALPPPRGLRTTRRCAGRPEGRLRLSRRRELAEGDERGARGGDRRLGGRAGARRADGPRRGRGEVAYVDARRCRRRGVAVKATRRAVVRERRVPRFACGTPPLLAGDPADENVVRRRPAAPDEDLQALAAPANAVKAVNTRRPSPESVGSYAPPARATATVGARVPGRARDRASTSRLLGDIGSAMTSWKATTLPLAERLGS